VRVKSTAHEFPIFLSVGSRKSKISSHTQFVMGIISACFRARKITSSLVQSQEKVSRSKPRLKFDGELGSRYCP